VQGPPIGPPMPLSQPQAYTNTSTGELYLPSPSEVKLQISQLHAEQLQGTSLPPDMHFYSSNDSDIHSCHPAWDEGLAAILRQA